MDFMTETAQAIFEENGYDDWFAIDDSLLECPHGIQIEWDGRCPEGCVSPLRSMGMI